MPRLRHSDGVIGPLAAVNWRSSRLLVTGWTLTSRVTGLPVGTLTRVDWALLPHRSKVTQAQTPLASRLARARALTLPFPCGGSRIGTAGIAVQVVGSNWPKPHYSLLITGLCRFRVAALLQERPFVLAEVGAPLAPPPATTSSPRVCVCVCV